MEKMGKDYAKMERMMGAADKEPKAGEASMVTRRALAGGPPMAYRIGSNVTKNK